MIILAIWPLATGLFCLWAAFRRHSFIKMIIQYPKMDLGSIKEGPVNIFGKITAHEKNLTSPVSETECVFYNLKLEQESRFRRRKGSLNSFRKVFEDEKSVSFYLEDDTGKLLVDPENLVYNVFMGITVSKYNATELEPDETNSAHTCVRLFKKQFDESLLPGVAKKYLRVKKGKVTEDSRSREFFLKLDSEVYLTGHVMKNEQNELIMKRDHKSNIFFMSHMNNADLVRNLKFYFFLYAGIVLTIIGITLVVYS